MSENNRLKSIVERIERLEEEKKAIAEDIKEVYVEAKALGYDAKILKMVIKERAKEPQQRTEQMELFDVYWSECHGSVHHDQNEGTE